MFEPMSIPSGIAMIAAIPRPSAQPWSVCSTAFQKLASPSCWNSVPNVVVIGGEERGRGDPAPPAERPALERLQHGLPEARLAELLEQRAERGRHRREVAARDDPDAHDELEQREDREDSEPGQRPLADPRRPPPGRAGGCDCCAHATDFVMPNCRSPMRAGRRTFDRPCLGPYS